MSETKKKPGFIKRWTKRLTIAFVVLLVVGGLGIWYAVNEVKTPPTEWEQVIAEQEALESERTAPISTSTGHAKSVETIGQTGTQGNNTSSAKTGVKSNSKRLSASEFEQAVVSTISKVRPSGEPWRMGFTQKQANQWLSKRLHKWLANQKKADKLPHQIKKVMVHFSGGQAKLMMSYQDHGQEVIIWLNAKTREINKRLHVVIDRVGAGQLETSPATVSVLGNTLPPDVIQFIERLSQPIPAPPVKLQDGRVVDVKEVEMNSGQMIVTAVTNSKGKKSK